MNFITPQRLETGDGRIPVNLLTGFLGAGKTTLLNQLLRHPDMAGTAVLINEFGEVGVDHHLVQTIDDTAVLLDSGCVCCSMNGDLVRALRQLHDRAARREIAPIRRVLIESTGLADPAPVVNALMEDRHVAVRFVCDGVVAVIDATLCLEQLERHPEALRQASMADLLLVSKTDLIDRDRRSAVVARLDAINPGAPCVLLRPGKVEPSDLFAAGVYAGGAQPERISRWLAGPQDASNDNRHPRHRRHASSVESFVVAFGEPVAWRSFAVAMGRILARHGDRLLRVKGLMRAAGDPGPVVVQCVQNHAYAPVRLERWPRDGAFADERPRLVFIAKGLGRDGEAEIRAALTNLPHDTAAVQQLAATPNLPTRCWLDARLPILSRGSFETEGWVVTPRRYRAQREGAH